MRYITMAVIGLALLVPGVTEASCFGRCHGGWSNCSGGCSGSCYGGRCSGCYGSCSGSCYGSRCSGCYGSCSGNCYGGRWGGSQGGCWGNSSYRGGNAGYGTYYSSYSVPNNYYTGYYSSPSDIYSSQVINGNTVGRTSSYFEPSTSSVNNYQVRMQVTLPGDNDELIIEGQKTTSRGSMRVFYSPALDPGTKYTYTVKMRRIIDGKSQEQTRHVDVQAGSMISVDFTRPNN